MKQLFENRELKAKRLLPATGAIALLIGIGIGLLPGCYPKGTYAPLEIDFNQIQVIGVDNSDWNLRDNLSVLAMPAEAVALRIVLSDSASNYYYLPNNTQASKPAVPRIKRSPPENTYSSRSKVVGLQIKTLSAINDTIGAGDDITDAMLYADGMFDVYYHLDLAIAHLNTSQSSYTKHAVTIVLKTPVENDSAQFEVIATLDNGVELSATTALFTIYQP